MIPFSIAGVQMHVTFGSNIDAMINRLNVVKAKFPWVQMVLFSELAPYGPLTSGVKDYPHPAIDIFREQAIKHNIWLIPGSMFERYEGKIYNTSVVIDPAGNIVGRYRKMFPFLPYEQEVTAGNEFLIFDVPEVGRFGLTICYDIWFPETTRTLTSQGVEVLLHPVLTGTIDREIEMSITKATAAMFQCFVVDINGLDKGGIGRSQIVNPTGTTMYESRGGEDILAIEIDIAQVRRQRENGLMNLGQPLKSFRDREVDFKVYDRTSGSDAFLHTLGPLTMPVQGSQSGINIASPSTDTADSCVLPTFDPTTL